MARTELTVETAGIDGLQPTDTALIADGHKFIVDKEVQFRINNGATGFTLTIQTPRTVDGLAVAEKTVSVGANEEHIFNFRDVAVGTFQQSDYMVYVDYSDVTDGTIAVWR